MRILAIYVFLIASILVVSVSSCERQEKSGVVKPAPAPGLVEATPGGGGSREVAVTTLPSFSGLVKRLKPAVVNISTTSVVVRRPLLPPFDSPFWEDPLGELFKKFFGETLPRKYSRRGLGSGFIISPDGYVVTNNHVIDKAQDIEVVLADESKYRAKVVGKDPKTDLALLKIEAKGELPHLTFGDSDSLEIGDWVLAIGNPFGLGHTVTAGIVSAKGRYLGLGAYDDFIQTDAPINPGNSGGPLFSLSGDVVGVNTAIVAQGQGIGFAIPSNIAKNVVEQLKKTGRVVRGWLGAYLQEFTPEIAEGLGIPYRPGILVADVTPGSPADRGGLQRGDIIVSIDGKETAKITDVTMLAAGSIPGTEMRFGVIRNGERKEIRVVLGEYPEEFQAAREERMGEALGIKVEELTPEVAKRRGLARDSGVIIAEVAEGSVAARAGLRKGDIILEINRTPIATKSDFIREVERFEPGVSNLFLIRRNENTLYVALRLD